MLTRFRPMLIGSALLASTATSAQELSPETIAADARRRAEAVAAATPAAPWGCVVLLCLANPSGPTAIAQCVDPIRRLWSALRSRRPFPTCPMAQGPRGGAYARLGSDHYDPCPAGTTEVPAGRLAYSNNVATLTPISSGTAQATALPAPTSNSQLSSLTAGTDGSAGQMQPRLCGSGYLGEQHFGSGESSVLASVYERIVRVPAAASPNYVEVMLDAGDGRGFTVWTRARY